MLLWKMGAFLKFFHKANSAKRVISLVAVETYSLVVMAVATVVVTVVASSIVRSSHCGGEGGIFVAVVVMVDASSIVLVEGLAFLVVVAIRSIKK